MAGPVYGTPRFRVVVENVVDGLVEDIPEWVIAGASVANFVNEVEVAPAFIAGNNVLVSVTPTDDTQPDIDYQVVVMLDEVVLDPQSTTWSARQIDRRRERIFEFPVDTSPPVRIIVNVVRGT